MRVTNRYLQALFPIFNTKRTKEIFSVNPTVIHPREDATDVVIMVRQYNATELHALPVASVNECIGLIKKDFITWINIDGLRKADIEQLSKDFGIHNLICEDILSAGQRPKMNDFESQLYCLLNMLYFNEKTHAVEQEQISLILGKNYVITFQEDPHRDVFDNLRDKLKFTNTKLRLNGADYLYYALLDTIVDHYFKVMEQLGDRMEWLEEEIIRNTNTRSLGRINSMRKEMIIMKRNVVPVKDVMNGFLRSESNLLQDRNTKYYKDIYDHIMQASDLVDNYRDMMVSLQDLYLNKANMKLNEVMKVMTIVTCLLAPATVIGGIFGMNFDRIPYLHHKDGFYIAVGLMLLIPVWMIWIFKRRGWF